MVIYLSTYQKIQSISKVTQINVNDSQEDGDLQFCHSEADQPPRPQRNTSEIQLEWFENLLKELGEQVEIPEVKNIYQLSLNL